MFSLTSLLVSAVVEYMGVPVTFTIAVAVEDICKLVGTLGERGRGREGVRDGEGKKEGGRERERRKTNSKLKA